MRCSRPDRGSGIEGCVGVAVDSSSKWRRGLVPKEEAFPRLPRKTPTETALPAALLPACRLHPTPACGLPQTPHSAAVPTLSFFLGGFRVFDSAPARRRLSSLVAPNHNPPVPLLQLLFTSGVGSRRSRIGIIHGQTMGQCRVAWQTRIHRGSLNLELRPMNRGRSVVGLCRTHKHAGAALSETTMSASIVILPAGAGTHRDPSAIGEVLRPKPLRSVSPPHRRRGGAGHCRRWPPADRGSSQR